MEFNNLKDFVFNIMEEYNMWFKRRLKPPFNCMFIFIWTLKYDGLHSDSKNLKFFKKIQIIS
jgi:hypothetical protein